MSNIRYFTIALALFGLIGAPSARAEDQSEVPLGLWQSPPDLVGVVMHVRTKRCGRELCGIVERVKNRKGYDVPSNAVGQKVLLDMTGQPDGSFVGEYRDPKAKQFLQSRVRVIGRELRLRACDGAGCEDLVWTRLR